MRQRIPQLAALVDGARGLRCNVAGNAARERELLDDTVQVNVNQVLTGHRAPVADDLLLDMLRLQRLLEEWVVEQIKLTGCKIICRPPVCVHFVQHFVVDVCCHSVMLPFCD